MATRTDDFNRSNEGLDASANWTEDDGVWTVTSNQVREASYDSSYHKARWTGTALDSSDYYCQLTIVDLGDGAGEGDGTGIVAAGDGDAGIAG